MPKKAWHLWRCLSCGSPRWEGPGWQLQQRLAAALQAGAALSSAVLAPLASGGARAAAQDAAATAVARFRCEAAAAAAAVGGAALPDALDDGGSGSGGDSEGEEGALAMQLQQQQQPALTGKWMAPSFGRVEEVDNLAELAYAMLAESCEWHLAECLHAQQSFCCPVAHLACEALPDLGLPITCCCNLLQGMH